MIAIGYPKSFYTHKHTHYKHNPPTIRLISTLYHLETHNGMLLANIKYENASPLNHRIYVQIVFAIIIGMWVKILGKFS